MIKCIGVTLVNKDMEMTKFIPVCDELSPLLAAEYDEIHPGDAPHQIARVLIEVESGN